MYDFSSDEADGRVERLGPSVAELNRRPGRRPLFFRRGRVYKVFRIACYGFDVAVYTRTPALETVTRNSDTPYYTYEGFGPFWRGVRYTTVRAKRKQYDRAARVMLRDHRSTQVSRRLVVIITIIIIRTIRLVLLTPYHIVRFQTDRRTAYDPHGHTHGTSA